MPDGRARATADVSMPIPAPADEPIQVTTDTRKGHSRTGGLVERFALPVALLLVFAAFSILKPDIYFTTANVSNILGSQAVLVVLALGLIVTLRVGEYDLSIASVLTLSTMSLALLTVNYHWPLLAAMAVCVAIGLTAGFINGLFVVYFGVNSLIVSLGTGTFYGGVVYWISSSNTITGINSELVRWVIVNDFLGVPLEFYYAVIGAALLWYLFEFTPVGQRMLFTGQSVAVARLSGINTHRIRWASLVASGGIGALAGILYAGTTGSADPSSGQAFLLPAFAAAFLGATSITPGRVNPAGTVLGVYFLTSGITGLQLMGADNYVQQLFYGAALVLAVTAARVLSGKRGVASTTS